MLSEWFIIEKIPLGSNLPFFNICKLMFISLDLSSITPFNFKLLSTVLPNAKLYICFIVHLRSIQKEQQKSVLIFKVLHLSGDNKILGKLFENFLWKSKVFLLIASVAENKMLYLFSSSDRIMWWPLFNSNNIL